MTVLTLYASKFIENFISKGKDHIRPYSMFSTNIYTDT